MSHEASPADATAGYTKQSYTGANMLGQTKDKSAQTQLQSPSYKTYSTTPASRSFSDHHHPRPDHNDRTSMSRHADGSSPSAPSSSPGPEASLPQRLRSVLSDFGKPPTAKFDSDHGIKPKTLGTVDTMSRPPRI
ncbi:hypothetical protein PG993_001484 [Apiospora rasikravindrae]|uniref:Uncharacterized protein n=1 Tax=Apiospora rasikravindrae TaxID=990691 RepID=A0ABR1UC43_9PEZI